MAASIACPKVWPKFKIARTPCSRSSRPRPRALIAQDRAMAWASAVGVARAAARRRCAPASRTARVPDAAVLDHFGQAGAELPVRQRRQRVRIGDDRPRLVEGADEILAARMVDAGLAADRGVDLRQQRGRAPALGDAALIAGRGEAGDVARPRRRPSASTAASRSSCRPTRASNTRAEVSRVLCCSPSGSTHSAIRRPARPARNAAQVQRPPRWCW